MAIKDRTTNDVVVLMLTLTVCVIVIISLAAVVIIAVVNPSADLRAAADAIGKIVAVLVGAVVGYVAGAQTIRKETEDV